MEPPAEPGLPEAAAAPPAAPAPAPVGAAPTPGQTTRRLRGPLVALGFAVLVGLQVWTLLALSSTRARLADLEGAVSAVSATVADLDAAVTVVEGRLSGTAASAAPGGPAAAEGALPRFASGGPDPAVGMTLAPVAGPEWYSGEGVTVDPADGRHRIWLVWAHWCPYCQRELPIVSEWWAANAADHPDVDIVSITTSIDPSRGNPLEPYLEELQLPFPVIVDGDLTLAARLGVNAFPFWIVTDGEGTVLFRHAGFVEEEGFAGLVAELQSRA